jgi:hypothetical protein
MWDNVENIRIDMKTVSTSQGRGCLVWLDRIAVFVGGLMVLGAIYETVADGAAATLVP